MFTYQLIFFFHISFRKLFKIDLRPKIIKLVYSHRQIKIDVNDSALRQTLDNAYEEYLKDKDKRKLWEFHRLDFLNHSKIGASEQLNSLRYWFSQIRFHDDIIFENMMECSLRASNILMFIQDKETLLSTKDKNMLFKFLKRTYFLNILCPDMYFKRKKFLLRDESNNHFIFCLFFQTLFKFFYKKLKPSTLNSFYKYINSKFSKDGFLMEGSSFYSFSVSEGLCKVSFLIGDNRIIKSYPNLYRSLQAINSNQSTITNLNFGDIDGTRYLPNLKVTNDVNELFTEPLTVSESLWNENISSFHKGPINLVLNHRKIYNYGTLGHYHDDYGHFNIYNNGQPIVIDPGTLSYADKEKRYDDAKYHNAPFAQSANSMVKHENFVKSFKGSFVHKTDNNIVTLSYSYNDIYWKRSVFSDTLQICDEFKFKGDSKITLFFKSNLNIKQDMPRLKIFESNGILLSLSSNHDFIYNIDKSIAAKSYSNSMDTLSLHLHFNSFDEINLSWEIEKCLN
jgi:hypothetical protein